MGSPMEQLLSNTFMIPLEDNALPKLRSCICNWRRYVDDAFVYVLPTKINLIISELNSNIKFTYKL